MSVLSKLDKLMFTIGVIDAATGPVNKIMAKVNELTTRTKSAMSDIATGAAGVAGAGLLIASSMAPAIDANAALGEVASLGVAEQSLMQLNRTALDFTTQFGGDAPDIIRSAYDIQSSIAGLTGQELSSFTEASNILAVATKADAATITDYMGTMYGIFEDTATRMGKTKWVEMLAGQTAAAVQLFKTDGPKMAQAFSTLGADAANLYKIPMNEQMAVMGQLQATMSGSEAGTKYKAFLLGISRAQERLGVSFTDNQGRLLPMVEILEIIQQKTAGVNNDVEFGKILFDAFGSKQALGLISSLLPKTEQLKQNVDTLGQQTGMQKAVDMATQIASPWDRLSGSFNSMKVALGQSLDPILAPLLGLISGVMVAVIRFSDSFPRLTGVITATVAGIVALIGVISAVNIFVGIYKFLMIGASATTLIFGAANKALRLGLIALRATFMVAQSAAWLFNAALLANPVGLVVAAIAGLIAIVAAVVIYWDELVQAFTSSTWGQVIIGVFDSISQKVTQFVGFVRRIFDVFVNFNPFDALQKGFNSIAEFLGFGDSNVNATVTQTSSLGSPIPSRADLSSNAQSVFNQSQAPLSRVTNASNVGDSIANNSSLRLVESINNVDNAREQLNNNVTSINNARVVERSSFIQNQIRNSENSTANNNSKQVYIEQLELKTEKTIDVNSLAELWELQA